MWRATLTRPIYFRGETHREGDSIDLTDEQMRVLSQAGVIGAIKRLEAEVETATVTAPETADRNYRRRPR